MQTIDLLNLAEISGGQRTVRSGDTLGPGGGSDPGNAAGKSTNNPFPDHTEEETSKGAAIITAIMPASWVTAFF